MTEDGSTFPCNTDAYQTAKNVTVVVYTRNHTIGEIVPTIEENKKLTVEVEIDGELHPKCWVFTDDVKPETMRIDKGGVKFEITFQKEKMYQWPKILTDEKETIPLYQRWKEMQIPEEEDKGEGFEYFIKKMYANATPEEQRAMMKSMQESGGTVLSGDWDDVGSRHVDPQPPGENHSDHSDHSD